MELKRKDSPLDLSAVRIKDEQVEDSSLHDVFFQPPEIISTVNGSTTVKNEEGQLIDVSSYRRPFLVPNLERPRKKQRRVLMESVLLPTLAEIQQKKGASEDDIKKLRELFKPKKKKKNNTDLVLSDKTLISRLKPIGLEPFAVDLPRAELNQMVSRWFMASTYGGSMQEVFPNISATNLARHRMRYFMYLAPQYHPYAPQVPGGAGLWFDPDPGSCTDLLDKVQRVFTRDHKTAVWQYMGQYEIKPTTALTRTEWLELKNMRYIWAKKISDKDWGKRVCARIQARKEVGPGREPTQEEVIAVEDSGRWKFATEEDVRIAFDCGKERMSVWTLKCIDYDYRFQLELYDKYPGWTPPSSKAKKKDKRSNEMKQEVKVEVKAEG